MLHQKGLLELARCEKLKATVAALRKEVDKAEAVVEKLRTRWGPRNPSSNVCRGPLMMVWTSLEGVLSGWEKKEIKRAGGWGGDTG